MGLPMRTLVVVGGLWGGCGGMLCGAIRAMVWWVLWGHRPNMCVACSGSRGGPSLGLRTIMGCFGMRHFAPWWMTVVCVGLASFGASSRVSGGTAPVTGGKGSCLEPLGA